MQVGLQIGARLSPGKGERIKVGFWTIIDVFVEPRPPPLPRQGEASSYTRRYDYPPFKSPTLDCGA